MEGEMKRLTSFLLPVIPFASFDRSSLVNTYRRLRETTEDETADSNYSTSSVNNKDACIRFTEVTELFKVLHRESQ